MKRQIAVTFWGLPFVILAGCSGGGGGSLTIDLSGCPAEVVAGDSFTITTGLEDPDGSDVTANGTYTYVISQGDQGIGIGGQNNTRTITIPGDAQAGAAVLTVTATLAGVDVSTECRFDIVLGAACTTDPDCAEDESCVDGVCVPDDPCEGVMCEDDEECVDGECLPIDPGDPCEGVMCEDDEECVDGECVLILPEDPCDSPGDASSGAFFYTTNCAVCHGLDGAGGPAGPSILDASCDLIWDNIAGDDPHPLKVDGATRQEAANVRAWLDSL